MSETNLEYYKNLILNHNKEPRNYGKLEDYSFDAEGYNPLCGDHVNLFVKVSNDRIESISFESKACALCKASSSLMTEKIKGMTISEFRGIDSLVTAMLDGQGVEEEKVKPLDVFSSVAKYPARAKCVLLPWNTLSKQLNERPEE